MFDFYNLRFYCFRNFLFYYFFTIYNKINKKIYLLVMNLFKKQRMVLVIKREFSKIFNC